MAVPHIPKGEYYDPEWREAERIDNAWNDDIEAYWMAMESEDH